MKKRKKESNKFKLNKWQEWKKEFFAHRYLFLLSILFLVLSLYLYYLAGIYTNTVGTVVAPDLILDNIKPINISFMYSYGFLGVLLVIAVYSLFFKVNKLAIIVSQYSLLIMVRNIFLCFTHLKTPLDAVAVQFPWLISYMGFQNDLFFSGHTALPFLGFLLFKHDKIRWFFLAMSIILGASVLVMHLHYSIDVFSAFFITYGTFKIGEWIFTKVEE